MTNLETTLRAKIASELKDIETLRSAQQTPAIKRAISGASSRYATLLGKLQHELGLVK